MVSGFVSDKNKTKAVQYKLSGHNSSALSSETVPAGQTECRENYGQMPHAMLKNTAQAEKYRAKPLTSQQTQTTMNTEANRKTEWVVGIGEALWGHTARRAEDRRRSRELRLPHVAVRAAQLRGQRRRRRRGGTRTPQPAPRKGVGHMLETVPFPTGTVEVTLDRGGHPQLRDPAGRSLGQHTVHPADRGARPAHPCSLLRVAGTAQPVSHRTIGRFLETMPDGEGQYKVFDINLRQHFSTRSRWSKSRC